jgi:hypothetical protein
VSKAEEAGRFLRAFLAEKGDCDVDSVWGLVLGSAAVAATVSGVINAVANWLIKKSDLERQDMEMALKMAELKHRQMVTVQEWNREDRRPANVDFWDPLATIVDYRRGMKEFRETGRWSGEPVRNEAQRVPPT